MRGLIVLKQASGTGEAAVTCIVSIATLVLNIVFYVLVAPRINMRETRRGQFKTEVGEFLDYLSDILSLVSFEGVLSEIAKRSRHLKLYFKTGDTPEPLNSGLEGIYQSVKYRKNLSTISEIEEWKENFRVEIRSLRTIFAKYTGVF